jgi:hypothetical protein
VLEITFLGEGGEEGFCVWCLWPRGACSIALFLEKAVKRVLRLVFMAARGVLKRTRFLEKTRGGCAKRRRGIFLIVLSSTRCVLDNTFLREDMTARGVLDRAFLGEGVVEHEGGAQQHLFGKMGKQLLIYGRISS